MNAHAFPLPRPTTTATVAAQLADALDGIDADLAARALLTAAVAALDCTRCTVLGAKPLAKIIAATLDAAAVSPMACYDPDGAEQIEDTIYALEAHYRDLDDALWAREAYLRDPSE